MMCVMVARQRLDPSRMKAPARWPDPAVMQREESSSYCAVRMRLTLVLKRDDGPLGRGAVCFVVVALG
jgi:hypothetical protein